MTLSTGAASPFSPGDTVDHFQIVRLLGQGGAGDVWLARDQVLGRKVALKMLRRADDGRTLNDLLDEARATATVQHPHVVTIYAVGSVRGAPYLALEYVDGVTLRQRLMDRAPGVQEALRFARDIAGAVAAAHETGILHLDLKPDNVLLGSDGRLRVVDFGLARLRRPGDEDSGRQGMSVAGTPGYMAPELWRGERPTEGADAWAFGVVLCELLARQVPYPQEKLPQLVAALFSPQETILPPLPDGVPVDVRALLSRLLQKDPKRRASFNDIVRVLEVALARPVVVAVDENPFRGLDAYRESDAARYFGRESEIEAFVAQLETTPFLPVVGHSGAGKSSFVRAGVIPRLREREPWIVVEMRPGARPFLALARALRQARRRHTTKPQAPVPPSRPGSAEGFQRPASSMEYPPIAATEDALGVADVTESGSGHHVDRARQMLTHSEVTGPIQALAQTLAEAPERLYLELTQLAQETGSHVLLFVDQLEEAETLAADEASTQPFLHALAAAADDASDPVRVVVTLRDDFLGRLAAVEALRGAFARVTVLRRPSLSTLVESIIGPLLGTGVSFDDGGLPLEMARAVEHEPAALPLLSFTCATLWERRDAEHKRLLRKVYTGLGGVVGALATHADATFDGLSPSAQRLARQLLLGLVTSDRTRRRRSRRELLAGLDGGAAAVLDRLIEARLLTSERAQRDDDSEIELAHESLVKAWARLARLLDEERDHIDFVDELQQVAEVWNRRGRHASELWTGAALQDALARIERTTLPLPETARGFLDEGQRQQQRRQRQRGARTGALVALLVVVAVVLFIAQQRAVAAATDAQQARSVAEREAAEAAVARGDVWSARAKVRTSLELDDSLAARALWRRLEADALLFSTKLAGPAIDGAFATDGTVVVANIDDRVYALDGTTFVARDFAAFRDSRGSINAIAVLGDRALVGLRDDGRVSVVDLRTGPVKTVDLHEGGVLAIVAVPSRGLFVTAGRDGRLRTIDRDGVAGAELYAHQGGIDRVAVSRDGRTIHALGVDNVLVEVPLDGREAAVTVGFPRDLRDLVVLPDGRVLVGEGDGLIHVVGPDRVPVAVADVGEVHRMSTDGAGRLLAIRSPTGQIVVWRIDDASASVTAPAAPTAPTAIALQPLAWLEAAGAGGVGALVMDAAGERLLTTTRDGDVRVWRIDSVHLAARPQPAAPYNDVAISNDGGRVAEIIEGGIVVRETSSGDPLGFVPVGGLVSGLALDHTGRRVLLGGAERVTIHDLGGGAQRSFPLDGTPLEDALWLRDGAIVLASRGGTVWRVNDGEATPAASIALGEGLMTVESSPDDALIAVGGREGTAWLLDARTLQEVRRFRVADAYSVTGVAFSANSQRVALSTSSILEVRGTDGSLVRRLPGERIIGACTGFVADGRVVDLRSSGALLVDADTGEETALANVPPTGSCEMGGTGLFAMRLGDYVLPFDASRDVALWFARGVIDDVVSTQRPASGSGTAGGWPRPDDLTVIDVDAAPHHLCSAEAGGAFVMRSSDGTRILARSVQPGLWPVVIASSDGCVFQADDELRRLRPGSAGPVVDVIATDVVSFGGGDGVVAAASTTGVRVILDGDRQPARALPLGKVVVDGSGVLGVLGRRLAHALPSGEVALWDLDEGADNAAAPVVVRTLAGDISVVLPLPGGLVAVGTSGERLFVIDEASSAVVIEEPIRGAVTTLHRRRRGDDADLVVGTNLGNVHTIDLGPFIADRCGQLRRVWAAAPVAWERGHPVPRGPPSDHDCGR